MAYGNALHPLTLFELDKGFYSWRSEEDDACPEYWAPLGLDRIMFHKKVDGDLLGGVKLEFLYLDGSPKLLTPGAYLDLGDEEVEKLVSYAQWVLTFKEGLKEAFENSEPFRQLFLAAAQRRGNYLQTTALYRKFMGVERDEAQPERTKPGAAGVRG
jgi:hypothetical protein